MAITSQHAGKSIWEARIKDVNDYMMQQKWNGLTSVTLEHHLDKHRMSFVALSETSSHVRHQLTEEHTRVTYLLDLIESKDLRCQLPSLLSSRTTLE